MHIEVKQLEVCVCVCVGGNLMKNCFSIVHNYWHPIIAMSFSQDNDTDISPIIADVFAEHLTRD